MGSLYSISKVDGFIIIGPADTSVAPASPSKTPPKAKNAPVIAITGHPDIGKTAVAAKLVQFLGHEQALHVSNDKKHAGEVQLTWDDTSGETDLQWAVRDEDGLSQVIIVTESRLGFTDGFKDAMDHLRIAKAARRSLLPVLLTRRVEGDKVLEGFNWDELLCYEDTKVETLKMDVTDMWPEEVAARILARLLSRLYSAA